VNKTIIAIALCAVAQQGFSAPLDTAHSQVTFTLKQMNSPMDGQFKQFSGNAVLDAKKPAANHADITIKVNSISLPTAESTATTLQKDWFNAAQFPTAHFVSNSIKPLGNNRYQFNGKLTIKGTTRDVSAPFSTRQQGALTLVEGTLPISRLAYKIGEGDWADTSTVADQVLIKFRIALPANSK
jgi:polyisoprenoid-binding protein YceI